MIIDKILRYRAMEQRAFGSIIIRCCSIKIHEQVCLS